MKSTIKKIANEIADKKGLLLIHCIAKGSNRKPIFEIFIDSKKGISADDCAEFSREVKSSLELTDIGDLDYQLVVSSPGIDEPIIYFDQYFKHLNREFKISYLDEEIVKSIEAKLLSIIEDTLTFSYNKEEINIKFDKIKKAKVKISF